MTQQQGKAEMFAGGLAATYNNGRWTPEGIAQAWQTAIGLQPETYGISFLQPMFRIWSIRTRGTDHEIQMNTRDTR